MLFAETKLLHRIKKHGEAIQRGGTPRSLLERFFIFENFVLKNSNLIPSSPCFRGNSLMTTHRNLHTIGMLVRWAPEITAAAAAAVFFTMTTGNVDHQVVTTD